VSEEEMTTEEWMEEMRKKRQAERADDGGKVDATELPPEATVNPFATAPRNPEVQAEVTEEMQAEAEEARQALQERRQAAKDKVLADGRTVRVRKGDRAMGVLEQSDIPAPKLEDSEIGPMAFAAEIPPELEITGEVETQEFVIDANKLEWLYFEPPGRNLPKKRLYTVKGLHTDGRLIQLPFEPQIENTAGGDTRDAIGLRRFANKGIKLLFDFETLMPIYCAAWGCWARADGRTGFCSARHAQHTLPNRFNQAGELMSGMFGPGATTSLNVWSS
jgi:hypothetical protein